MPRVGKKGFILTENWAPLQRKYPLPACQGCSSSETRSAAGVSLFQEVGDSVNPEGCPVWGRALGEVPGSKGLISAL